MNILKSERCKIAAVVVIIWSTLLGICWLADTCNQPSQQSSPVNQVPDDDDESNPMLGLKLVQFTASWCGPCKQQDPIIQRMANEGYHVLKCDIDRDPQFAKMCKVTRVPTLIIFVDGEVKATFIGVTSYETLTKKYNEIKAQYPDEPVPPPTPTPTPPMPKDDDDSGLPVKPDPVKPEPVKPKRPKYNFQTLPVRPIHERHAN